MVQQSSHIFPSLSDIEEIIDISLNCSCSNVSSRHNAHSLISHSSSLRKGHFFHGDIAMLSVKLLDRKDSFLACSGH